VSHAFAAASGRTKVGRRLRFRLGKLPDVPRLAVRGHLLSSAAAEAIAFGDVTSCNGAASPLMIAFGELSIQRLVAECPQRDATKVGSDSTFVGLTRSVRGRPSGSGSARRVSAGDLYPKRGATDGPRILRRIANDRVDRRDRPETLLRTATPCDRVSRCVTLANASPHGAGYRTGYYERGL